MVMNGVNYNTLMGNSGLFPNQTGVNDDVIARGAVSNTARNTQSRKSGTTRYADTDRDTYEYTGQSREVKAGYERPKRTESQKNQEYKALDSNGVQDGIELSESAANVLKELREKYGNMSFSVAKWSTDEEQDYYASLSDKEYSVLINPELLEKMAKDDALREKYEGIIGGADEKFETLKTELGEDADKVTGFNITMDQDGNVSYAVKLFKDMVDSGKEKSEKAASEKQQERAEERRSSRKKAASETQQEQIERVRERKRETEKIEASSIEDLIAAIRKRLHPQEESENGMNITGTANNVPM